jgi:CheY-like chemotaxis protein
MKILLVEDNRILRENLIFLLKKFSYVVESAENGKIAYDKIISQKFQAIILDLNMPVMNGKEFLTKIRKDNISIPVIALTSDSMLQDKLEMFEL